MTFILLLIASYLLGSVPLGLLLARLKGVDIRKVGSGNIGATNVFRSISKTLGVATFVGDALKGFIPTFFFPMIGKSGCDPNLTALLCGCAAIAGHNWPIYLHFKGGKGVSTSAGMLLGLAPAAAGIGLVVWAILVAITRYVSVASIGAAIAVPAAGWWLYTRHGLLLPVSLTVLGLLVIWKHRANIARLKAGTEHRFGRSNRVSGVGVQGSEIDSSSPIQNPGTNQSAQ